jgi:hypothetical protein
MTARETTRGNLESARQSTGADRDRRVFTRESKAEESKGLHTISNQTPTYLLPDNKMQTVSIDRTTDSIDSHISEVKEAQKSLNNKKRKVFAKNDPDHHLREK